jgi:hypothetical protein
MSRWLGFQGGAWLVRRGGRCQLERGLKVVGELQMLLIGA